LKERRRQIKAELEAVKRRETHCDSMDDSEIDRAID